jgi:K+-transporting ATPase ATPase C chain
MPWGSLWSQMARLVGLLALVTGGLYTLLVTGVLEGVAPLAAQGSLVSVGGRPVASLLVGQAYPPPRWFTGRPSATVGPSGRPLPYDAAWSGGSNLAADSQGLLEKVRRRLARYEATYHVPAEKVPTAMVEASASGLDPDIPLAAALQEVPAVARATGLPARRLRALVEADAVRPLGGLLGGPYVNVVRLNVDLYRLERSSHRP